MLLAGEGRVIGVLALEVQGGYIRSISSIVNPDKLSHLGPVTNLRALLRPPPRE
jgi:RNA polymerase sigma-70 factor, ECF subfamily